MFGLKVDGFDMVCSGASLAAFFFLPCRKLPRPTSPEAADSSRTFTLHSTGTSLLVFISVSGHN